MGSRKWHIQRAKHHATVADFLVDEHADWFGVALFYSALHWVHSSLADEHLGKDERHPRKHTGDNSPGNAGRGTNQLVRDLYPGIHIQYRSLFEASLRTRYDVQKLGPMFIPGLRLQHQQVREHCLALNATRPPYSTSAP